jgi:hypothetical protein
MVIIDPGCAAATVDVDTGNLTVWAKGVPAVSKNKVPVATARDFLMVFSN